VTIRKGDEWGRTGAPVGSAPVADSDAAVRHLVTRSLGTEGEAHPIYVGLTGGALWECLGGASVVGRLHTADAVHYPVDVIQVDGVGERRSYFVNALVARSRGWPGWRHATIALNGQLVGGRRLGSRAHPGDVHRRHGRSRCSEGRPSSTCRGASSAPRHPGATNRASVAPVRPRPLGVAGWRAGRPYCAPSRDGAVRSADRRDLT
jgi:hypothetical protein